MSFHVFFGFSSGLKEPLQVPPGTLQGIHDHIRRVEETLHLERSQYKDNPTHWNSFRRDFSQIDKKILCRTVSEHNDFVRRLYHQIQEWSKVPVVDGEIVTPEDAATFWHGLEILTVPLSQWTEDYYTERMEALYEVMRGRETDGIRFDAKALTPAQAAAVIRIFDFLDPDQCDLDVPKGCDYLASSKDGGYDWCEKCGAVPPHYCCRKRQCPVREEEETEPK